MAISDAGVATIGKTAYLVGGENPRSQPSVVRPQIAAASIGGAVGGQFRFSGRLVIADRGNNRLLVVTRGKQIIWRYPSRNAPAPRGGFYSPDDSFFTSHGKRIIVNQEGNETIVQLAYPSGRVV